MIHPLTELRFIDETVGLGLFATARIPRGTVVWALDPFDLQLSLEAAMTLPLPLREAVLRGAYTGGQGQLVFCWDHARYMNHCCRPNCVELGESFEVAARTIMAGEELTCDYNAIGSLQAFECRCGGTDCVGFVEVGSKRHSTHDLDELLELAARVAQPLLDYAQPEPQDGSVLRALGGQR